VAVLFISRSPLLFPNKTIPVAQATNGQAQQGTLVAQATPGQAHKTTQAVLPTSQAITPAGPTETLPPFQSISGLPPDIPVLPQNYGDLMNSDNNSMTMYSFTTWLSLDKATEYYRKGMLDQGWTIINTTSASSPPAKIFTFSKDNNQRMVNVQVSTPKQIKSTMVMLMVLKIPQ
jgi:hypothetical protein